MRKSLVISFLFIFAVSVVAAPIHAKNKKAYWGLSVGQMNYQESGTALGSDYDVSYSFNSFSSHLGTRINENFSLEARYAVSNTSEEDVLGVPVEAQVSRVLAGFAKFKPKSEKITPYGLLGYSDAEVEACGTSCTTISSTSFSYGAGLQFPIGKNGNQALKLEYVFYGESSDNTATAELSEVNVGVLF